jgi:AcrR family transcriptional regulator
MSCSSDNSKTDTRSVIKDTFLSMIQKKPFHKIHVTKLCKKAGIARATFYAYYNDIFDLLNEIIDDALSLVSHKTGAEYEEGLNALWDMVRKNDLDAFKKFSREGLPPPNRIIDFPKYYPLFKDEHVFAFITKRIFEHERMPFVNALQRKSNVSQEEAECILRFLIAGTMAVNQHRICNHDDEWYQVQLQILRFIMNGYVNI